MMSEGKQSNMNNWEIIKTEQPENKIQFTL